MRQAANYHDEYVVRRDTSTNYKVRRKGQCDIFTDGRVYFAQVNHATHERRSNGPVLIYPTGTVKYQGVTCRLHRADGPAVIWYDGTREYWINGREIPELEFFATHGVR